MLVCEVTERIKTKAFELLELHPEGLRYSELHKAVQAADPSFKANTISGSIWNLDSVFPERVYKPSKGLFRLTKHKPPESEVPETTQIAIPLAAKAKEEAFYLPFADWLVNEVEDATQAIPLGGNIFKDKWGTPDVVGKLESRRSDIIKGPTEIIAAEIKTETDRKSVV